MAAVVAPLARSHAAVVIGGMLIYAVTLYTGFWSTPAYLVPLAALLCWYIDGWFSPAQAAHGESDPTRVRWPGDPIGRLTAAVNRRWPPVATDRIGHS